MRHIVLVTALLGLAASAASAQNMTTQSNSQAGPQNPAIKSTTENNSSTPVAGANSFTQGEAVKQIEAHGYTNVSGLSKDSNGVWRGRAIKDGKTVSVSLDYQGNVNQS